MLKRSNLSTRKNHLRRFLQKMKTDGCPKMVRDIFAYHYNRILSGENGLIPGNRIEPLIPEELPHAERLRYLAEQGENALRKTAMGHAISFFDNVGAVRVPRTRFLPVKKSSDLMIVRSDLMKLSRSGSLVPHETHRTRMPSVHLDPAFYKTVDGFGRRLPDIPSLRSCNSLEIKGDVKFEPDVVLEGDVSIYNHQPYQAVIPRGSRLRGMNRFP